MSELNPSIIKWINQLPWSDQEALDSIDGEVDLLIKWLRNGERMDSLRDLYRKLADELDDEDRLTDT